jgi:hypothetical protein
MVVRRDSSDSRTPPVWLLKLKSGGKDVFGWRGHGFSVIMCDVIIFQSVPGAGGGMVLAWD